jgi:hypothetical protein
MYHHPLPQTVLKTHIFKTQTSCPCSIASILPNNLSFVLYDTNLITRIINSQNKTYFNTYSDWGKIKRGNSLRSILGPFLFLIYINDLPNITNKKSKILPFAYESSKIINKPNSLAFINKSNKLLTDVNEWIEANLFSFNVDKTYFMQYFSYYHFHF